MQFLKFANLLDAFRLELNYYYNYNSQHQKSSKKAAESGKIIYM